MKIKLENNNTISELEVLITHSENDPALNPLLSLLASHDKTILCSDEKKQIKLNVGNIYYIESIDKKTYLYTTDNVYSSGKKLYELLDGLDKVGFCQVSKFCLININRLVSIEPLFNSRLGATMENGEKVIVTRKYIPMLKEKL